MYGHNALFYGYGGRGGLDRVILHLILVA